MVAVLLWFLLLVLCWPVAIAALVLFPLIWLILLPLRLLGAAIGGTFALITALFLLPFKLVRVLI
ncbi:MAG TPA: hypothetical protein VN633_10855 [Bryobacteraceae bacterium]|nr:hypothetical protein [Bryobacteraceae bacterium]